jgi:hypothetical protein
MIRLIFLILFAVLIFSFSMKNSDETVMLHYFFGISAGPFPLYQVVLGTLAAAVFLVVGLLLPEWVRLQLLLRIQRRALEEVETELSRMKPRESSRSSGPQHYEDLEI